MNTNKQYGLVLPTKKKKKKRIIVAQQPDTTAEDEDSGHNVRAEIAKANEAFKRSGEKQRLKAEQLYKDALSQDASVFDYDGVYDTISTRTKDEQRKQARRNEEKSSKYIDTLMRTAKQREFVNEKAKDRKAAREEREEEAIHGKATEVFVTGAYKRRLEERRQWELQEAKRAAEEAKNDVRKRKDLSGFYSGLLGELEDHSRAIAPPSNAQTVPDLQSSPERVGESHQHNGGDAPHASVADATATPSGPSVAKPPPAVEEQISEEERLRRKRREFERHVEDAKRNRLEEEEKQRKKAPAPKTTADRLQLAKERALARRKKMQEERVKAMAKSS